MRRVCFGLVMLLGWCPVDAATRPMTPEDVVALQRVSSATLSPDGSTVAFVVTSLDEPSHVYQSDVWLVDTADGEPLRLTHDPKDDRAPAWSPDGRWLAFLSSRKDRPQIFVLDRRGGEARQVTQATEAVGAFTWSPDSSAIAFLMTDPRSDEEKKRIEAKDDERVVDRDHRMRHLWTIGIMDGEAERLTQGEFSLDDPQWSPTGEWIAAVRRPNPTADDRRHADVVIVPASGGEPRVLYEHSGPDTSPRWSPDGSRVAFVSRAASLHPTGHDALYVVGATGGDVVQLTDLSLQPGDPVWSPDGSAIRFTAGSGVRTGVWSVPVEGGPAAAIVDGPFVAGSYSESANGARAYVREDPTRPADVWVQQPGHDATPRTMFNPQVAEFTLGEARSIRWTSTDGLEVEGLLFLPPGADTGQALPMVVEVHGGPAGVYNLGFPASWGRYTHVLTGRGWAVFQPNFRGSSNYGDEFLRRNIKDWGRGDFADIMTGIDRLVADGVADPERLALRGWSYGGYMTAWAVTQTDRFKAASAGAGLTNLVSMYGTNDIPSTLVDYFGGAPWDDFDQYRRASAMTFIREASTPTLVLHGERDERVPLGQSQEFYLGLRQRGVPTALVVYPREPHGLGEPNHQLDKMEREIAWFDRHVLRDPSASQGDR